jgi:hypothetical protein
MPPRGCSTLLCIKLESFVIRDALTSLRNLRCVSVFTPAFSGPLKQGLLGEIDSDANPAHFPPLPVLNLIRYVEKAIRRTYEIIDFGRSEPIGG